MDSGLHTLGWTRQQTVDYMMANSGWAPVDIQNEIDRYISWPATQSASAARYELTAGLLLGNPHLDGFFEHG